MTITVAQAATAVKPQTVTAVQWGGKRKPPTAWLVADPDASHGADLAHQWGHEDATEGKRRGGDVFVLLSPEYSSYHQGYNEGLRLRQQLTGDVCQAALDEAAWFDEIIPAAPVAMTMSEQTLDDMEEEWIGNAFSREPYNW